MSGVTLSCFIFSPEVTERLEEYFDQYTKAIGRLWTDFQSNIAQNGGVIDDKKETPSSQIAAEKTGPIDKEKEGRKS